MHGLDVIPAARELDDADSLELALIENVAREDLTVDRTERYCVGCIIRRARVTRSILGAGDLEFLVVCELVRECCCIREGLGEASGLDATLLR